MSSDARSDVGLVFDDRYLQHNTGQEIMWGGESLPPLPFSEPVIHPSNYRLAFRSKHLLDLSGLSDSLVRVSAYKASVDDIALYHDRDYIARAKALDESGGGDSGNGAPVGKGSYDIALLAAGGVMAAVDAVMAGEVKRCYALVRPPGHHAIRDLGMGYCIFNNVVIAAKHAQRTHGIGRVMILDWDVHDGNGTQEAFYEDDSVLFFSLHQDRFYPATMGLLEQTGAGVGTGSTVNLPLPSGSGDAVYMAALERIVAPIAREFRPELIIISAGQDASLLDPSGRMCISTEGYRRMTSFVMALADEFSRSRLVLALEGGYSEVYAPYCTMAIFESLLGRRSGLQEPFDLAMVLARPDVSTIGPSGAAALDEIQAHHAAQWPALNRR